MIIKKLVLSAIIALSLLSGLVTFNIDSESCLADTKVQTTTKMPTVKINNQEIKLEIAQTPQEIERGLMMRTSLAPDSGMVFLFNPPKPVNFWMYNCYISLDMIFVRDGKIIKICENVPPERTKDYRKCPTYPPGEGIVVNQVIEVAGGYCQKKGIKEGDAVEFSLK